MKKLFAWLVVFALCLTPLGAWAEQVGMDRLYTLSIGNFSFALNGQEEQNIPITLAAQAGAAQDGSFVLTLGASGEEVSIGKLTLVGKDQKLAAYLDGTSNAYAITREEGAQLVDEVYNMVQLNGEAMGLPEVQQQQAVAMLSTLAALLSGEDLDAVLASLGLSPDLMETMRQLYEVNQMSLEEMEALNQRISEKALPLIGVDLEAPTYEEEGEILGETMPLKGYAFSLDGQDLGKIYELLGEEIPGYGQAMDLWLSLMSTSLTASGYPLETSGDKLTFGDLFQSLGIKMEGVIWMDEDQCHAKVDMVMEETVPAGQESYTIAFPLLMEVYEKAEDGARSAKSRVYMDLSQTLTVEGQEQSIDGFVEMTMDMNQGPDGAGMDMQMDMDMRMDAEGEFVEMTMDMAQGPDGASMDMKMDMDVDGEQASVALTGSSAADEDGAQRFQGQMSAQSGGAEVALSTDGFYRLGEDGGEDMEFNLTLGQDGQQVVALNAAYTGQMSKGDGVYERGGRATLDVDAASGESVSLGMDLNYRHEPLTQEMLEALDGLPTVSVIQLLTDQQAQMTAMVDLQTAMYSALGGIMQIPGMLEMMEITDTTDVVSMA